MVREIIFLAKEYRAIYNSLMQSFLLEYEDYEEIDFINEEIELYNMFKIDITYYKDFCGREVTYGYKCSRGTDAPDGVITDKVVGWRKTRNAMDICDAEQGTFYIDKPLCWKIGLSFDKIIEFLEHKKENLKPIHILKAEAMEDVYLGQPTNDKANKLFDYLIDNYRRNETTSVKYVNILHYLKNDVPKDLYIFNLKQVDYKEMIQTKFSIEIKKFAKSERYDDVEKHILNTLLSGFLRLED